MTLIHNRHDRFSRGAINSSRMWMCLRALLGLRSALDCHSETFFFKTGIKKINHNTSVFIYVKCFHSSKTVNMVLCPGNVEIKANCSLLYNQVLITGPEKGQNFGYGPRGGQHKRHSYGIHVLGVDSARHKVHPKVTLKMG